MIAPSLRGMNPETKTRKQKMKTYKCDCGYITGTACEWQGPCDAMVVVEWMPNSIRASHEAAGNSGRYPHNGAVRLAVESDCADSIVESDPEWSEIIADAPDKYATRIASKLDLAVQYYQQGLVSMGRGRDSLVGQLPRHTEPAPMKLNIKIDTENAAFEGQRGAECARILRELADRIDGHDEIGGIYIKLKDANGNHVGEATATKR